VSLNLIGSGILRLFLLGCTCYLASACALPGVAPVPMPSHTDLQPRRISPGAKLALLGFEAAILNIKRGTAIGSFPGGYSPSGSFCNFRNSSEMTQTEGRKVIAGRDGELAAIFYQTLTDLGYRVVGDPSVVFERKEELDKARYLVAARITDMRANICNVNSLWDGRPFGTQSGEVFLEIEWSVYSSAQRSVVLTLQTTGYNTSSAERRDGFYMIFADAFANATRNFGASGKLVALVDEGANRTVSAAARPTFLRLRSVQRTQPLDGGFSSILDSVVTVRAGRGHGSGFVISPEGYILTNAHVVAGNDEVTVMFKAGFELAGRVVRIDKPRDVALIKVQLSKATPLPLQPAKPRVGDEVIAIGTPVDLALEKTATRGIVSSIRFLAEFQMELIQSDVLVQPGNSGGPLLDKNGNVIGIAAFGIRKAVGLNFFVPIGIALESVGVTIE
jgi:serine protease Do